VINFTSSWNPQRRAFLVAAFDQDHDDPQSSMRPLRLHASALNNDEYDLYTSSLKELAEIEQGEGGGGQDDEYFERITLGVREVRAWLRGRYSSLPAATVDTVSPTLFVSLSQLTWALDLEILFTQPCSRGYLIWRPIFRCVEINYPCSKWPGTR
jgi:hypothetical protein